MKHFIRFVLLVVPLILASCGTKRAVVKDNATVATRQTNSENTAVDLRLAFAQKVNDRKVYVKNIVADMTFTANMDGKNISVPGAVRMRRDEVIRLQLFIPLLGSEVGRVEFTPDYVLVIDRMHKQYVKGDYNQLSFLKNNGLNFYSLQALFWNHLMLPGSDNVSEADLRRFQVVLDGVGKFASLSLKSGNLDYLWLADREQGFIGQTNVTYRNANTGNSELNWKYDNFKAIGAKSFPATQEISFTTTVSSKVRKATFKLDMSDFGTSSDWETRSTVSDRYKQVEAKDVLGQLLKM